MSRKQQIRKISHVPFITHDLTSKSENVLVKNVRFELNDDTANIKCVILQRVPDSDFYRIFPSSHRDLIRLRNEL